MEEKRHCIECGKEISGRKDRKYCSEACRISHNNQIYSERYAIVLRTNRILRKNYLSLDRLMGQGIQSCSCSRLILEGFNFDYFTSMSMENGKLWIRCYDYTYQIDEKGMVSIEKIAVF